MEFYTTYDLQISGKYKKKELFKVLLKIIGEENKDDVKAMLEGRSWESNEKDYSEKFKKVSEQFPNLVFLLEGNEGKEADEGFWLEYFKNGDSEYKEISF